jgi:hypothetical protein
VQAGEKKARKGEREGAAFCTYDIHDHSDNDVSGLWRISLLLVPRLLESRSEHLELSG